MAFTVDTDPGVPAVQSGGRSGRLAWWVTGPGAGELRSEAVRDPGPEEVLVRTLWTGVSRGTETLVLRGEVPVSEHDRMRAPFQEGAFPFPVKYGYLNVGVVDGGPLDGRTVFSLAQHQSRSVLPAGAVTVVPPGVPARRAVLAGAVETAVNVLWDAAPRLGDRVTVVGAGMIGCSIARLAAGIPGVEVELVDVDSSKAPVAVALGAAFASPDTATPDRDIVIEASGSPEGLALALRLAATDSDVVVASWFGSRPVPLELGADFHSRRLTLRSSQVGAVASARRERRTTRQRLALALGLLADPAFDVLLSGPSPYTALPDVAAAVAAGTDTGLCHTIDWSAA
jgi:threonine dehydrogenase-like Zn-dependent dehydrogenase